MSSVLSRSFLLLYAVVALILFGQALRPSAAEVPAATGCTPLETRDPDGSGQQPAFAGQTRACEARSNVAFDVVVLSRELEHPWAVEQLPDGDLLVTERPGRMRIVSADGKTGAPIQGVPAVVAKGQGGLLDVALSPQFASDRTIFWSYSEPRADGNGTSVARAVLSADRSRLEDVRVILRTRPSYDNNLHFGSRLVFATDGALFVTMGERSDKSMRQHAQKLDNHLGKVLRITAEGAAAPGNPFAGQEGALPEIWSLGHRNIQSAVLDQQGRLWEIEHGARGGDELNLVEKGKNYGWAIAAYGKEYIGFAISGAQTQRPGTEQPVYYWDPVIAPSGMEIYTGDAFPQWRGSVFVGGLKTERLVRLTLQNDRVTGEEHLLADRKQRIRDVRQGNDGFLYIVTDQSDGELWKLTPKS
ncbi:MAG TPA: PQQ-dependent sugar dehydrogenase [Candidatus Binatia bacterium]|nr:PQQ-dependent sugar dehydrogenase [Candidatus Binatia bacterium]